MAQEKTEGIVLRKVDFGDTSSIVTLLTPDRGRAACMVRGLRRKKSPMAGVLDTFNRVEMVWFRKEGRGVQNLAEAGLLDGFPAVKRDLERVTHAAFLLEICLRAANENEPSRAMYAELVRSLTELGMVDAPAAALVSLEALRLLTVTGHAPELGRCADTGAPAEAALWFSHERGLAQRIGDTRLDGALLASLRGMAAGAPPPAETAARVFGLMAGFASRQYEADFRSVRVIRQMFG